MKSADWNQVTPKVSAIATGSPMEPNLGDADGPTLGRADQTAWSPIGPHNDDRDWQMSRHYRQQNPSSLGVQYPLPQVSRSSVTDSRLQAGSPSSMPLT